MEEKIRFRSIRIDDSFILHRESGDIVLKLVAGEWEDCQCCCEYLVFDSDGNEYNVDDDEMVTLLNSP